MPVSQHHLTSMKSVIKQVNYDDIKSLYRHEFRKNEFHVYFDEL